LATEWLQLTLQSIQRLRYFSPGGLKVIIQVTEPERLATRAASGSIPTGSWCIAARIRLARPVGRTRVPLRCLRPARARRRYRRLALPRPGHRRCRSCGRPSGPVRESSHDASASADAVGSQFGSQVVYHLRGTYPGAQFCLVSVCPPAHPQGGTSDESDCLRAVRHYSDNSSEYEGLPALPAPRPRLERGTYCLGGIPEVSPDVAGRGLMCRFVRVIMAGCGLEWPHACAHWLPVWLPGISLAALMFDCSRHEPISREPSQRPHPVEPDPSPGAACDSLKTPVAASPDWA
jgi:hypothetical protein